VKFPVLPTKNVIFPINGFASPKYENLYIPAGVPGSIVLDESHNLHILRLGRIRMNNSPRDVNGAVSGKAVGSQPLEPRGWVRIGPNRSPDVALEPVHGQERLLQPQVILQPTCISTNAPVKIQCEYSPLGWQQRTEQRRSLLLCN